MSENKNAKKIVERGYDQVAHEYARLEGEIAWPRMKWLKKLLKNLPPSASILDLGCGSGDPVDVEVSKKYKITGVDISEMQISLARRNVPDGNFIHEDVGSIEFPPHSFDAVISFYTLEHIPRKEHQAILRRIYQWLKTDGYILISLEAGDYDDEMGEWLGVPMFFSCYDPETMRQIVIDAGFTLIESEIETQIENGDVIPFLWIFGQKNRLFSRRT